MDLLSNCSPPMSLSDPKNSAIDSPEPETRQNWPPKYSGQRGDLRSVKEIALKYRHVFPFQQFNTVQSKVLDDALYSDKSIVVAAPTGSGKTVVFELAIIHLLKTLEDIKYKGDFKIIYMAPIKALCTEKLMEWHSKFSRLGVFSIEVTGDTEVEFAQLKSYSIILTTPEKWDIMTRRWRDNKEMVHVIKLFMIDEVHILNDCQRGPVLEAVVSRMKTIQASMQAEYRIAEAKRKAQEKEQVGLKTHKNPDISMKAIRFVSVSATAINTEDVATWLGNENEPAVYHKFADDHRPVRLNKVVEGFSCPDGTGLFKFDIMLNYKLRPIINKYADGKPTLIFCNSRKSVILTAEALSREITIRFTEEQMQPLRILASQINEKKLQNLILSGIGCHHAGFIHQERNLVEKAFREGSLPILVTTTTLAMGVNLPAHLVIIKTTQQYVNGSIQEHSQTTILQMMGRAGRPQFDTEGTAVIMTKMQNKSRYEQMVSGGEPLESWLHVRLCEHVNSEAALGTLADLAVAMQWARSTFLYVRAMRAPRRYLALPDNAPPQHIEKKIEELCLKAMNALARAGMLTLDETFCVTPTEEGRLMAVFCLDFETMKLITQIKGTETILEILELVCSCHELSDTPLRMGERSCLNLLNRSKNSNCIKYPLKGKICTKEKKVNCIIQAVLGCIPIPDPSLNQESLKIKRVADRIAKCILSYITRNSFMQTFPPFFNAAINALLLAESLSAQLWNDSVFVTRQLKGIGVALSTLLASSGKTTFKSIIDSNPRDLERIINKAPPTGNILQEQARLLPSYSLTIEQLDPMKYKLLLNLVNYTTLCETNELTAGDHHKINLIIGDSENNILHFSTYKDIQLIERHEGSVDVSFNVKCKVNHTIVAHCISSYWVGLNVKCSHRVVYTHELSVEKSQTGIKRYLHTIENKLIEAEIPINVNTTDDYCDVINDSQDKLTQVAITAKNKGLKKKNESTGTKSIADMFKEQKKRINAEEKSLGKKAKFSKADNIIKNCIQQMIGKDSLNDENERFILPTAAFQSANTFHKTSLSQFAYEPTNILKSSIANTQHCTVKHHTTYDFLKKKPWPDVSNSYGEKSSIANTQHHIVQDDTPYDSLGKNPWSDAINSYDKKSSITNTQHRVVQDDTPYDSLGKNPWSDAINSYDKKSSITNTQNRVVQNDTSYDSLRKKLWTDVSNSYDDWLKSLKFADKTDEYSDCILNDIENEMREKKYSSHKYSTALKDAELIVENVETINIDENITSDDISLFNEAMNAIINDEEIKKLEDINYRAESASPESRSIQEDERSLFDETMSDVLNDLNEKKDKCNKTAEFDKCFDLDHILAESGKTVKDIDDLKTQIKYSPTTLNDTSKNSAMKRLSFPNDTPIFNDARLKAVAESISAAFETEKVDERQKETSFQESEYLVEVQNIKFSAKSTNEEFCVTLKSTSKRVSWKYPLANDLNKALERKEITDAEQQNTKTEQIRELNENNLGNTRNRPTNSNITLSRWLENDECEQWQPKAGNVTCENPESEKDKRESKKIENTDFKSKLAKILQENNPAFQKTQTHSLQTDNFDLGIADFFERIMENSPSEQSIEENQSSASSYKPIDDEVITVNADELSQLDSLLRKFQDEVPNEDFDSESSPFQTYNNFTLSSEEFPIPDFNTEHVELEDHPNLRMLNPQMVLQSACSGRNVEIEQGYFSNDFTITSQDNLFHKIYIPDDDSTVTTFDDDCNDESSKWMKFVHCKNNYPAEVEDDIFEEATKFEPYLEPCTSNTQENNSYCSPAQRLRKFQISAKPKLPSSQNDTFRSKPLAPRKFVTSKMQRYLDAMKKYY